MNNLFGLSEFSVVVPAAVVLGSFLIKKLFKVSFLAALAGISGPLVAPLRDLPILKDFPNVPHANLLGGAWGSVICCCLIWMLLRPLASAAVASLGLVRLGYLALLGAALIVAGLLVINPEPLSSNFPGWKGPAGIILLAASCVSVSRAVWQMVRASALVAVWGGVSLVLASSIFLDKLPQNLSRDDLNKISGVISSEFIDKAFAHLQGFSVSGAGLIGFLRVADQTETKRDGSDSAQSVDA